MKIIRGLKHLSVLESCPRYITIGNFDGVHLGHQSIINQLKQAADEQTAESVVVIFEPQPQEFFQDEKAPARITSLREKLVQLNQLGVDMVVCLRFNKELAALSAKDFVQTLLVDGLCAKHVIIGDDFRFGESRAGGYKELEKFGSEWGFSVAQTGTCEYKEQRISSSWIRQLLAESRFDMVETLLGRPYQMIGRVRHGDKRGRELGFPTINIAINRRKTPLKGVFVSSVIMDNAPAGSSKIFPSVSNIGTRPVFSGNRTLLETHLLDFDQDLYGQYLKVELHEKIRDEVKFNSVENLKKQISMDVAAARLFFEEQFET